MCRMQYIECNGSYPRKIVIYPDKFERTLSLKDNTYTFVYRAIDFDLPVPTFDGITVEPDSVVSVYLTEDGEDSIPAPFVAVLFSGNYIYTRPFNRDGSHDGRITKYSIASSHI